jgi:DNA mismatch repair protein MSH6
VLQHLQAATQRSIVALDELGRGTATTDGAAIAAAVLEHLSTSVCCRCVKSLGKPVLAVLRAYEYLSVHKADYGCHPVVARAAVSCRGLFATHYHRLSDEHAVDPRVAVSHMACAVTPPGPDGQPETVTFLYQLAEGADLASSCSKILIWEPESVTAAMSASDFISERCDCNLTAGACPKSYGMNVARLAGLPTSVVARAATIAHQAEVWVGLTSFGIQRLPVMRRSRGEAAGICSGRWFIFHMCFSMQMALSAGS